MDKKIQYSVGTEEAGSIIHYPTLAEAREVAKLWAEDGETHIVWLQDADTFEIIDTIAVYGDK